MKIQLVGEAREFNQVKEETGMPGVKLHLSLKGKVVGAIHTANEATAGLNLHVKALIAEQLKFGQKLYITVDTNDPEQEVLCAPDTSALRELAKTLDAALARLVETPIADTRDRSALHELLNKSSGIVRRELGL